MPTVYPESIKLNLVDQSGNLIPADVIEISPSPFGKSDLLAIEVRVTIDLPPTDVEMKLKILTRDHYSFDDGAFEKAKTYQQVRNNDVLIMDFVIKNLRKLEGFGIGLEAKTRSTKPGSGNFKISDYYNVKYKKDS